MKNQIRKYVVQSIYREFPNAPTSSYPTKSETVWAYDAADAVVQVETRHKNVLCEFRVLSVNPAIETDGTQE